MRISDWSSDVCSSDLEARVYRPQLAVRFLLNRCAARTVIARETAETLADHDPPLLATTIGQRVTFADTARSGRLVSEVDECSPAAREIAAPAVGLGRASCRERVCQYG